MASDNHDFFGDDGIPGDALEHIDDPTVHTAWEGRLQEMCGVVEHALKQRDETQAAAPELARHVVFWIADTLGGSVIYLPRGENLKRALRDAALYRDWHERGASPHELARQYRVAVQTAYAIIARQRAIRRRLAPDLFGFDDDAQGV